LDLPWLLLEHLLQAVDHRIGEGGIVDGEVELDQLDLRAIEVLANGLEERLVRAGS